ncbi:MAG TPA: serine hydrolase [Planctomycetota bacterium]|nr:serine hydrolase [Planctomycetota bacterium]
MVFPARNWEEATPDSQGVSPTALSEAIAHLKANTGRDGVNELAIIRNGRMIWRGPDIDKVHGIWSATKSFTSTVLGLLVDDGKCTLDTLAKDRVPALAERYGTVRLRHFATMTSGYRAVGDEPRGDYVHGPSPTPFVPGPPLFTPPGSKYAYWDSAMNEFGLVLTRIAGEPLRDLFKRQIADPIGMDPKKWSWGDLGKVDGIAVNGGSGNHGKHVLISAREMARFGHLFLNRGNWDGQQRISAKWVEAATSVHVPAARPEAMPGYRIQGAGVYGLNWWVNGTKADGQRKWPHAPPRTFAASGFNNNKCFVVPEWGMVVVRLGLDGNVEDKVWDAFFAKLSAGVSAHGATE